MDINEKEYKYAKNEYIYEVKKTACKIIGYEQLDWKNISQLSKYDKKENLVEKILKIGEIACKQ